MGCRFEAGLPILVWLYALGGRLKLLSACYVQFIVINHLHTFPLYPYNNVAARDILLSSF